MDKMSRFTVLEDVSLYSDRSLRMFRRNVKPPSLGRKSKTSNYLLIYCWLLLHHDTEDGVNVLLVSVNKRLPVYTVPRLWTGALLPSKIGQEHGSLVRSALSESSTEPSLAKGNETKFSLTHFLRNKTPSPPGSFYLLFYMAYAAVLKIFFLSLCSRM
jgi:hypothetical protein